MNTKVGVFDSGIGGLSVAKAIEVALPDVAVTFVNDHEHMPYGDRSPQEVLGLVLPILEKLVNEGNEAIVIACNTVTTTLIDQLRARLAVPLIGVEPMIKSAIERSRSGTIAVFATPVTLHSRRYTQLKARYAHGATVIEPDCRRWAYMIEHDEIDWPSVRRQVNEVCRQGADVIVLGCTHYHWIEGEITRMAAGRAIVMQPEQLVIQRLKRVLARLP